jgi:soluble lytic murein transglycosylase-like protein
MTRRNLTALALALCAALPALFSAVPKAEAQSAEVAGAIHAAAVTYGVSEPWLRRLAYCESRFSPWVTSRGGHAGLFQYAAGTWRWMSGQAGLAGASPYDPWAASLVTAWALRNGYAGHWSCR